MSLTTYIHGYLPAIVVMVTISGIGTIGNLVATVFYLSRRHTSTYVFLFWLAATDTVICIVPFRDVFSLHFTELNAEPSLCKALHFIGHWCIEISSFTLLAISVDRHRRICQSHKQQLSERQAKVAVVTIVVTTFLVSCRNIYTFNPVEIQIDDIATDNTSGVSSVHVYYCDVVRNDTVAGLFGIVDFIMFTVGITIIVLCYSFILAKIKRSRKRFQQHRQFIGNETPQTRSASENKLHTNDHNNQKHQRINKKSYKYPGFKPSECSENNSLNITEDATTDGNDTKTNVVSAPVLDILNSPCKACTVKHNNGKDVNEEESDNGICAAVEAQGSSTAITAISDDDVKQIDKNNLASIDAQCKLHVAVSKLHKSSAKDSRSVTCLTSSTCTLDNRSATSATLKKYKHGIRPAERQLTLMTSFLALALIVTFVPYFMAVVKRKLSKTPLDYSLNLWVQIGLRMPYLSSALRPVIYLVSNPLFRGFITNRLYRRHSEQTQTSNFT